MNLAKAAGDYVKHGWPIFPCDGKKPLTSHGFKDATTDPESIARWWEKHPEANIGLAVPEGMVVVDVDDPEALSRMKAEGLDLPSSLTVETGRGCHVYYRCGASLDQVELIQGVDLRVGGSGYVVAPPSIHESGKVYRVTLGRFDRDHIAEAPSWIAERAKRGKGPKEVPERITKGSRDNALASLAGTVRSRGFSQEAIEAALLVENRIRCTPPLPDSQVSKIAKSISRYEPTLSDPYREGVEQKRNRGEEGGEGDHYPSESDQQLAKKVSAQTSISIEQKEKNLRFRSAFDLAQEVSEEVDWVVEGYVARGAITEVGGKVKWSGKTTLAFHMVSAVLSGQDFAGLPTLQTPVVYLSEQTGATLGEALKRAGLLEQEDLHILLWNDCAGVPWKKVVEGAVEECKRVGARLLIVDTLGQFANLKGDAENSAGPALEAMKPLQLAAATGLAVLITRHDRKGGGEIGDSARGSSAISGAVDVVLGLRRGDGRTRPTIRILHGLSRFEETPDTLVLELTPDGYQALGSKADIAAQEARRAIFDALPETEGDAITIEDLRTGGEGANVPMSSAKRILKVLIEEGTVIRSGRGRRGDPYRYWGRKISAQGDGGWAERNDERCAL